MYRRNERMNEMGGMGRKVGPKIRHSIESYFKVRDAVYSLCIIVYVCVCASVFACVGMRACM